MSTPVLPGNAANDAARDGTDAAPIGRPAAERRLLDIEVRSWPQILAPSLLGIALLALWEGTVWLRGIPHYILPSPLAIVTTLWRDWGSLAPSLLVTLEITYAALASAVATAIVLAMLFTQWGWLEKAFLPYAVVLQVTPIVAIAPLIIIWVNDTNLSLLICAWLVAFFPILSNSILGLRSVDHNLLDLFEIYHASQLQTLVWLKIPAALPSFLAGLRISAGLSLIGAVVAEFVAGTGGTASGLAYRILEASYQINIPRMFASLLLIALFGIANYLLVSWLTQLLLGRWHESAVHRER
jgi:NitT/TauT family transport system permease protein